MPTCFYCNTWVSEEDDHKCPTSPIYITNEEFAEYAKIADVVQHIREKFDGRRKVSVDEVIDELFKFLVKTWK